MTRIHDYLWCLISGSTAICHCYIAWLCDFGETKVDHFDVPCFIYQDVFKFDVSMDHAFVVQVSDCKGNLHRVEFDHFFVESLIVLEHFEELTASDKRHHKK